MEKKKATAQISYNTKEEICEDNLQEHVKPWKQGKYRDFLLTLNCEIDNNIDKSKIELLNKFNNLKKYLLKLKYTYILCSLEINKRNYYHIHIFIQFDTPHKFSIPKMEGANIKIINKTINIVIDYVKKDGVILNEFGYPRYITGNPSIKDISLSRFSEINENSNAKFYRVYKEIKKDNQGLFNTPKTIYIRSKKPSRKDTIFKDFNYLQIDNGIIKRWPINMILINKNLNENNINLLLNEYNEPIQFKYFPADIEKILFIIPNDIDPKYTKIINLINKFCDENNDLYNLDNEYDKGILDSDELSPNYNYNVIETDTEYDELM